MIDQAFNGIFRGKKVLVTGHTGFKGSWLSIWLKELGAEVIGFSLEALTKPSNYETSDINGKINSIIGDLRDSNQIADAVQANQPEMVFHLAAQTIVRNSYKDPKLTYDTNISGLVNLLEVIRQSNTVKAFLNITSDKCYDNIETMTSYKETDYLGGIDPYSASKACSEIISSSYRRGFFIDQNILIATARAGNVIGGGDWAIDRIIPDCVRAISQEKDIQIRNPEAIRPWQHVLEPLSGYLWLMTKLLEEGTIFAEAWNFGPLNSTPITVEQLVRAFIENWKGSYKISMDNEQPHEARFLQLDCEKARKKLAWEGILSTEEAIKMTIDWYRTYYEDNFNMYNFCCSQIGEYTKRAKKRGQLWAGG